MLFRPGVMMVYETAGSYEYRRQKANSETYIAAFVSDSKLILLYSMGLLVLNGLTIRMNNGMVW